MNSQSHLQSGDWSGSFHLVKWFGLIVTAMTAIHAVSAESPTLTRVMSDRPLTFEQNLGQYPDAAVFIARGPLYYLTLSPTEVRVTLFQPQPVKPRSATQHGISQPVPTRYEAISVELLGANRQAKISGEGILAGRANYFLGNDPAQWRTGVPTYERVRVADVYPGINLLHYGNQQQLEYDFEVAPGIDPGTIVMAFRGAKELRQDSASGELVIKLGEAELRQPKPVIYQNLNGKRQTVEGDYVVSETNTVHFAIGPYDHTAPLIIDPLISYVRVWGGSDDDIFYAIAVDPHGSVYVAGETMSLGLATAGAFQTNLAGILAEHGDVLVAKMDNQFQKTNYVTYLGGFAYEAAFGLAVDGEGNAYVTGYTASTNFPTRSAVQTNIGGVVTPGQKAPPVDAFVTKISPSGSNLVFSTFLGGNADDTGLGIALDANTNVFVVGQTTSANFPTRNTTNSLSNGFTDAFITKLDAAGTNILFSRYVGGIGQDYGRDVAVGPTGDPVMTGFTSSGNFPITSNAFRLYLNNVTNVSTAEDAFVSQLDGVTGVIKYSTYLGGAANDEASRLALDPSGAVYVAGQTWSRDFLRTTTNFPSAVVSNASSYADVFVTKLTVGNTNADYSIVFGGANVDQAWDIAVDALGRATIVGETSSLNFPTNNASATDLDGSKVGGVDAFIAQINAGGDGFIYSGYLGSVVDEFAYGVVADVAGNTYLCGQTAANGTKDGFAVKMLVDELPALSVSLMQTNLNLTWSELFPELIVQSSTNLVASNNWKNLGVTATVTNFQSTVILSPTNPAQFFRLTR